VEEESQIFNPKDINSLKLISVLKSLISLGFIVIQSITYVLIGFEVGQCISQRITDLFLYSCVKNLNEIKRLRRGRKLYDRLWAPL